LAEAMPDTPKQRAAIAASDRFIIISVPDLARQLRTNEPLNFQASGIGIVSPNSDSRKRDLSRPVLSTEDTENTDGLEARKSGDTT
jgi:hypothetical protein